MLAKAEEITVFYQTVDSPPWLGWLALGVGILAVVVTVALVYRTRRFRRPPPLPPR